MIYLRWSRVRLLVFLLLASNWELITRIVCPFLFFSSIWRSAFLLSLSCTPLFIKIFSSLISLSKLGFMISRRVWSWFLAYVSHNVLLASISDCSLSAIIVFFLYQINSESSVNTTWLRSIPLPFAQVPRAKKVLRY